MPHPRVNRVIAGRWNIRCVSRGGCLAGGEGGKAIRQIAGGSVKDCRCARAPRSGKGHRRVIVIEDDFIVLLAQRTKWDDHRPRIKAVGREKIELIEIAVIFVHLFEVATQEPPVIGRKGPAMAAVHKNDSAAECAGWLPRRRRDRPERRRQRRALRRPDALSPVRRKVRRGLCGFIDQAIFVRRAR
jgi:hypothetical protein